MDSHETLRTHKRRAVVGLFCCCPLPSDAFEPDSRFVRITAGVIAIIAMLLSGIGFSALQRDTLNPYEHLFVSASSSRNLVPAAWGLAPAPAPFLQPKLQQSGGSASAEGTGQASPEEAPQAGAPSEAERAVPAGNLDNAAMAASPMQPLDSTGNRSGLHGANNASGPSQGPGSQAPQGTASLESAAPDGDSSGFPETSPAQLGVPSSSSATGNVKVCIAKGIYCTLQFLG